MHSSLGLPCSVFYYESGELLQAAVVSEHAFSIKGEAGVSTPASVCPGFAVRVRKCASPPGKESCRSCPLPSSLVRSSVLGSFMPFLSGACFQLCLGTVMHKARTAKAARLLAGLSEGLSMGYDEDKGDVYISVLGSEVRRATDRSRVLLCAWI